MRINGLDTDLCYRDVLALVEKGGERLDTIMIPKVGTAADVYAIDMLITQASSHVGRKKKIGLEVIIETAQGLGNIDEIAGSSARLESLHFGSADYAASQGMRTTNIGGGNGAGRVRAGGAVCVVWGGGGVGHSLGYGKEVDDAGAMGGAGRLCVCGHCYVVISHVGPP